MQKAGSLTTPATQQAAADVIDRLASFKAFSNESIRGGLSVWFQRASTALLKAGLALLMALVPVTAILKHGNAAGAYGDVVLVGVALLVCAGLLGMLFSLFGDAMHLHDMRKRSSAYLQAELAHDLNHQAALHGLPLAALEDADFWLAQKSQRLDQRLQRFFGGSDKLAVLTLVGGAWAIWEQRKDQLILGTEPSLLLYGLAFLAGLVLGGLMVSQQIARIAYLRDVLALAIRHAKLTRSPP